MSSHESDFPSMISLGPMLCICPQHGWIWHSCQLLCLACVAGGEWWFRPTCRTGSVYILWLPHGEAGRVVGWVLTSPPFGTQLWIKRIASLSAVNTVYLLESPGACIWKGTYSEDLQHPEKSHVWSSGWNSGEDSQLVLLFSSHHLCILWGKVVLE